MAVAGSRDLQFLTGLERELVAATSNLRILAVLAWPRSTLDEFLRAWRAGAPRLPESRVNLPPDLDALCHAMDSVMRRAPREHPVGDLLWRTAWSSYPGCLRAA